ncbi:Sec-independent protein translocase subunit TatA/TatB [Natronospira bacteriovora]|uniref:Twin-arginine translocase TatA/TatE family subunit n=1 Tax=Natronospira bacteriovora TaxID=3069753 RepID=A0ABU0W9M2_9GAMM|nr:twin-arginine translocase TatA/TatE family subunit [Natronospira sp. AB-CW4]MDQ2069675.1 twin-arginine translocase TatA/TatE family subunit [Natronospira sp. AB-CW4]
MGIWEILLIALVILVVAGPERLPVIMRSIGSWVGRGRATLQGIQAELEREGEELRRGVNTDQDGKDAEGREKERD